MKFLQKHAALITLVGVAIVVFYVVKQSGGFKGLFGKTESGTPGPAEIA